MSAAVQILALPGLPMVQAGDDLARLLGRAAYVLQTMRNLKCKIVSNCDPSLKVTQVTDIAVSAFNELSD